jgi:DNA-directed RNA polymerase specialized sigma24 family protein
MYEAHEASGVTFAVAWAEVSPRLAGYLRKRGNVSADVDDLLQIVAERVLVNQVSFESADDLLHWCLTVARNLDIDRHRSAARHPPAGLDAVVEPPDTSGLEERVMWRLRLAATLC